MRNTGLDEAQAGIKIARRNVNNLRYADYTTLMAESEEIKSLLMKGKEESEKVGLQLNIQKTKIMASGPITSWQTDGETETLFFGGSKVTADGDWSHEIKRCLLLGKKVMTNHAASLSNFISLFTFMHWGRKWQPTPIFLPGESQGRGSLVGCRLWGRRVRYDWSNLAAAATTREKPSSSTEDPAWPTENK